MLLSRLGSRDLRFCDVFLALDLRNLKLLPRNLRGLLHFLSLYPIGTLVQLSSGEIGKVVHASGRFFDKPIVTIFVDKDGTRREKLVSVDLSREEHLSVAKVIEVDLGLDMSIGFSDEAIF